MCLTTRGVTVMEPMKSTVCLCAWSTNQNKALTGAQFSCGAASLCAVLPAPAPFSSPFNHCLFTLSQELNEPWLRALPGKLWRPCPALPSVSHPLCPRRLSSPTTPPQHIQSHGATSSPTHIKWIHERVCVTSLHFLSLGRYWGLLWLDHYTIKAPLAVLETEVLHMGHVSSCSSVKAQALKKHMH